jgi:hypothetical protein
VVDHHLRTVNWCLVIIRKALFSQEAISTLVTRYYISVLSFLDSKVAAERTTQSKDRYKMVAEMPSFYPASVPFGHVQA